MKKISDRSRMTISNMITISRLALLPFIVYFLMTEQRITAFILILISFISDGLDGYVARKLNQESELGKSLDPLCDKISLAIILITLLLLNSMPLWGVIVIITRDFLILLGSFILLKTKSIIEPSNLLGKMTGFIFAVMVLAFTLNMWHLGMLFLYLSIPVMTGTFYQYARNYLKIMRGA